MSNNIVIIPARGGSKGVPRKNLQPIDNMSLVRRAALNASLSDSQMIIVSTDSKEIADDIKDISKVFIHWRSIENSSDNASTESVISEVLSDFGREISESDKIAILQPSSPFTSVQIINESFKAVQVGLSTATMMSSVQFRWGKTSLDKWIPTNHQKESRPRRQDLINEMIETGSCYAFMVEDFIKTKSRFSNDVLPILQDVIESTDIDSYSDLEVARSLAKSFPELYRVKKAPLPKAPPKIIFTDFDGCMTDDRAIVNENGIESVTVNRKDGAAISRTLGNGIVVVIVSTEENDVVSARAQKLKIECLQGVTTKLPVIQKFLSQRGLDDSDAWYVGNDENDREPVKHFFSLCPADAIDEIKDHADIILQTKGGAGIFAELARLLESEYRT